MKIRISNKEELKIIEDINNETACLSVCRQPEEVVIAVLQIPMEHIDSVVRELSRIKTDWEAS